MRAAVFASSASISAFTLSKPSSIRKRRSKTARQRSATQGVWMPSTGWPPDTPLTFRVARAAPGGTTGMRVARPASAGCSSVRTASRNAPIGSIALWPRNGMLPWAMRPWVVTANQ